MSIVIEEMGAKIPKNDYEISIMNFLTYRINNWYDEALHSYDILGKLVSIEISDEDSSLTIKVTEDGIEKETVMYYYYDNQYKPEIFYNIWQESLR